MTRENKCSHGQPITLQHSIDGPQHVIRCDTNEQIPANAIIREIVTCFSANGRACTKGVRLCNESNQEKCDQFIA
jgi:hypothetical protein